MITNPSLPPLDRLAELADYFRTAEVSADVLVLSKADVAEFRVVCEAVTTAAAISVCADCEQPSETVCCQKCYNHLVDEATKLEAVRDIV